MCKILATDVKSLREKTGVGMMECKKALAEANGDMDQAIKYLRERGLAAAAKKSGRKASEGLVNAHIKLDKTAGALIEVNCETDFVAMNADFQKLVQDITELVILKNPSNISAISTLSMADGRTVAEVLTAMIQTLGENINISRFVRYEVKGIGVVHSYIHSDFLTKGKEGVILECATDNIENRTNPEFVAMINNLTLQISAYKPEYVRREDVPSEVLEHEAAIYKAQAINEGKSSDVIERITQGRIERFYKEVCLLEQPYFKDPGKTVGDVLKDAKLCGMSIAVVRFTLYEKGKA